MNYRCAKCQEEKPAKQFRDKRQTFEGKNIPCRKCCSKITKSARMKQRLATALNMAIDYEAGDRAKSEIAHQLRLCFDYRISEWEFPMILAYGQDQISQVMQQAVANFKQHHQLKAAA